MPFIWDDLKWKWVNNQESYDKSRFVVVRKLRVRPNTHPRCALRLPAFSVDSIRKHSEQFGHIKSVEILPGEKAEAHVTYVDDYSAYLMQSRYDEDKRTYRMQPFQIQPADTWEQPREHTNPPAEGDVEQTSEIFKLNEDCLLHLFMFLDVGSLVELADVCKLFNRLLHRYCFPRIWKFEVDNVYSVKKPEILMPLAKMRRILQCIGPYITNLIFKFHIYSEGMPLSHDFLARFLEVLVENVGTNIRRAGILCIGINKNQISLLAPIFQHLEVLMFGIRGGLSGIDFHAMCPNLVELVVNARMSRGITPWKSLRRIHIIGNVMSTLDLVKLIELNPQLTHITCTYHPDENTPLMFSNSSMLEKIKINCADSYDDDNRLLLNSSDIVSMSRLQHLTEISLTNLHPDLFKGILDCLATFVGLRKIHLEVNGKDNEDGEDDEGNPGHLRSLIQIAMRQPKLEEFKLEGVPITETALMDFVRFASQLKSLTLWYCGLQFSDELILDLVDVLKFSRRESCNVLVLKLLKLQHKKLNIIANESVSRYLQVKLA